MRKETRWFTFVALLVGAYVIARAALVPWVNDECLSLYLFVEPGEFLPYHAEWDANNHFLSTAIGAVVYKCVGLSLFGMRTGSVLAFGLFAWAVFLLGSRATDRLVRWCLWLALLACPFAIDFFSLFRGYGLALAFWTLALEGLLRLIEYWSTRTLVLTLLSLLFAQMSVLTTVPLWAIVLVLLVVQWVRVYRRDTTVTGRWQQLFAWLLLGVLPLVGSLCYTLELKARGQLYYGSLDGLLTVTIDPLLRLVLGGSAMWMRCIVIVLCTTAFVVLLLRSKDRRYLLLIPALLVADLAARIFMAHALGVNYPMDRAALQFVPLAILLVGYALDLSTVRIHGLRYGALLLLVLPARTVINANVDHTPLWTEQSVPEEIVRAIAARQQGGPMLIGGPKHVGLALAYDARSLGLPVARLDRDGARTPWDELRLVTGSEVDTPMPGFRVVQGATTPRYQLLERTEPLALEKERAHMTPEASTIEEYLGLWRTDTITDTRPRIVDIEGTLDTNGEFADLVLVISMKDSTGADQYYSAYPLRLERPRWRGEHLRLRMLIPSPTTASSPAIYIWNIHKNLVRSGPFTVTMYRPAP